MKAKDKDKDKEKDKSAPSSPSSSPSSSFELRRPLKGALRLALPAPPAIPTPQHLRPLLDAKKDAALDLSNMGFASASFLSQLPDVIHEHAPPPPPCPALAPPLLQTRLSFHHIIQFNLLFYLFSEYPVSFEENRTAIFRFPSSFPPFPLSTILKFP